MVIVVCFGIEGFGGICLVEEGCSGEVLVEMWVCKNGDIISNGICVVVVNDGFVGGIDGNSWWWVCGIECDWWVREVKEVVDFFC